MVSIIVPIYKAEKYLEQCVKSVLGSSFTDIELILVDDGSPDSCGAMCDRFASLDARVKAVHQANGGVSAARNAGLAKATGGRIMFVDSDDTLDGGAVKYLSDLMDKTGADIAAATFHDIDSAASGGEATEKVFSGSEVKDFIFRNLGNIYASAIWAKMYSRSAVEPFEGGLRIGEDILFNLAAFGRANKIVYSSRQLYGYRRGVETSITNTYYAKKHRMYVESFKRMCATAKAMGASSVQTDELKHHFIRMILNCMTCVYTQADLTKRQKKAEIASICRDADVAAAAREWAPSGARDRFMKSSIICARAGTLYMLCALEIGRQRSGR